MSDYIAFELQIKIMEGLPAGSLIRFRSVSKRWKSIIDSSDFIADYNNHHARHHQYHHVLVSINRNHQLYVSAIDDDDNFFIPHKSILELPLKLQNLNHMIGYSQGLFGFYDYTQLTDDGVAIIWNPSIRKSVNIPVPNVLSGSYATVFGFGVCNATDPMIVKINCIANFFFETISSIPSQVEVYKLSTGKWISLSDTPRRSLIFRQKVVVTERFIYWLVYVRTHAVDALKNLILSFDMISEKFTEISLPPGLANSNYLDLSKFKESLVVLETKTKHECGVWMMMEHSGQNSFIKLYTVRKRILGFRKNGQPIIELRKGDDKQDLIVYEPGSGHFNDSGISAIKFSDHKGSYMYKGTLLLLDH